MIERKREGFGGTELAHVPVHCWQKPDMEYTIPVRFAIEELLRPYG